MSDLDDRLLRSPIHRALSRPSLLLGADRELVLLTGLASAISAFVVLTWYSVLFGLAVWIVILGVLRMMAKSDPMLRQVYVRHLRHRRSYRPSASPWRGL
jgi:type IV secretion system protein TrbD